MFIIKFKEIKRLSPRHLTLKWFFSGMCPKNKKVDYLCIDSVDECCIFKL